MRIQPQKLIGDHSLKSIVFWLMLGFVASAITFSIIGYLSPILVLNENQVLYLSSTSSQVIAAVYGLTLTGLIFFINELNREQADDETKEASTRELRGRYFLFLLFITVFVGATICLSNAAISTESKGPGLLNSIIINAGQSAFAFSLMAISIFIFEVVDPEALEKASGRVKEVLDPSLTPTEKGSLEDFVRNFNSIEAILQKYGEAYQYGVSSNATYSATSESQWRPNRRLSNGRLADILLRNEKIPRDLHDKIRELISIRNSIVHGADPVVSKHIVNESIAVLDLLRRALSLG